MTIPPFDDNGNLPPGIHFCAWDEFLARFDTTVERSLASVVLQRPRSRSM